MRKTIKDVAKKSGVSISTVSRVVNSPESVRKEKRIRVQKAIKELNYSPNSLARGLISKKTNTIGVLIPEISNFFTAELVKGIEEKGRELGYNLILCNTGKNKEMILDYVNVLYEKQIDGLIFSSQVVEKDYYELFNKIGIPVVLAATESFEYNLTSVKIDDEKAAYDATKFLIHNGHHEIAMISGPITDTIAGLPRIYGFKKAYEELLGKEVTDKNIEHSSFHYDEGYIAMKNLLKKNPAISAIFCAGDEVALGAISYIHEIGKKVPEDVSIMGFDDTPIAKMSHPKLTSLKQPIHDIGSLAMSKLDELIETNANISSRTYVPHSITIRDSVQLTKKS